jgi:hypothetical protein
MHGTTMKNEYLYSEAIFKERLVKAHCSLDISDHCISILYTAKRIYIEWHECTQQHEQSGQDFIVSTNFGGDVDPYVQL